MKYNDALIVVDMQVDFITGTLAVPNGFLTIGPTNQLIELFDLTPGAIIFTQDWHIETHPSFSAQGGPWPKHCVERTVGAQIHPAIVRPRTCINVFKGQLVEEYSGFTNELDSMLKYLGKRNIYVCGLALDYCVRATALDALKRGFNVTVVEDATRAVEKRDETLAELRGEGAFISRTHDVVGLLS